MLRDDVGQLLWIGFAGPVAEPKLLGQLARGEIGATILFKRNLVFADAAQQVCDLDALVELNASLHVAAADGTPSLVAVDQEGGVVARVRAPATIWPMMMTLDRHGADDVALAEQVGRAIGEELRALGFDIDFAPVLDVHTNPANPIIGDRAFGTEPEAVARRALAFARGLEAAGMLSCGKHFPGHGDTATDSHLELPSIDHHWERLEAVELLPFVRASAAKLPMIMTAHVVFAALDPTRPATLSPQVVTGLLREKLGYQGVIVSDDLDMRAIAGQMGADVAAVAAIRAGCDVLLLCRDEANQAKAEAALIREGEVDSTFREQLGIAANRVRAMKAVKRVASRGREVVGSVAHARLAERLKTS